MNLQTHTFAAHDGTDLCVHSNATNDTQLTCLLIHGSGEGAFVWREVAREAATQMPIALIDLRGHGDSGPSRSGRYDLGVHVNDVAVIIGKLRLQRVVVVGHSLGALVAMYIAGELCRERTVAAMLVDMCPEPNRECMRMATSTTRESMRTYDSPDEYAGHLMSVRPLLSWDTARSLAMSGLKRTEDGWVLKLDPAVLNRDDRRDIDGAGLRRLLERMDCRTLVVRGEASAMVTPAATEEMVRILPNGSVATVACAGHAVMSDNPGAFASVLGSFLRSVSRAEETALTA